MRKMLFILTITTLLVYCKSKKKTQSTASTKTEAAAKPSALAIAQKRWSGCTQSDLDQGKKIFENKCTSCHRKKNIVTRSEQNWLHEIDKMSPRAELTAAEKEKLTRYILSYREANTTTD